MRLQPRLHIAAYDVRHPRRLQRMLRVMKGYALGGQKSVFECFLTPGDRSELLEKVRKEIDLEEDSFILLRLDPRTSAKALGIAQISSLPAYFLVD